MDPHMADEDELVLDSRTHRRLRQKMTPLPFYPTRKKKLVNFKISSRRKSRQSIDREGQGEMRPKRNSVTFEDLEYDDEDYYRGFEEERRNLNEVAENTTNKGRPANRGTVRVARAAPADNNGNQPNGVIRKAPVIEESERPELNRPTTPNKNRTRRLRKDGMPLTPRRMASLDQWNKLRSSRQLSIDKSSSLHSVVTILTSKRKSRPAPTIWTPSVPRPKPAPRPANLTEQEERGRGTFVLSFVTLSSKPRLTTRQGSKHQDSVEKKGPNFMQWFADIAKDARLQEGVLLRGMENGVFFPVIHISEVVPDNQRVTGKSFLSQHDTPGAEWVLQRGVFEEVVCWIPELLVTCPSDPSEWARCYIILGFKTLEGELNPKMESQWREWTGALYIYCNVSDDLGLKRLSFYRRRSRPHPAIFTYVVLVELDTVTKDNLLDLLDFVYRMKMKSMSGYISVYQECASYANNLTGTNNNGSRASSPSASKTSVNPSRVESPLLDLNRMSI